MDSEEIKRLIEARLPGAAVTVSGGEGKFEADVVSDAFRGLSTIQAHRLVYSAVSADLTSGALHALSIRTRAP